MATPDGKVTFEAGGHTRTLQFTTNHCCLLEDKTGKSSLEIAAELDFALSMKTARAMFWAGLGEGDMTLEAAGMLIDELSKPRATQLLREAFSAAFPKPEKIGKEGDANPPGAAAG